MRKIPDFSKGQQEVRHEKAEENGSERVSLLLAHSQRAHVYFSYKQNFLSITSNFCRCPSASVFHTEIPA